MNRIINFLGSSLHKEKEYHGDPDPRTTLGLENPVHTRTVVESDTAPMRAVLSVKYHDRYYYIDDSAENSWDREAFRLLYQLFQMSVTEVPCVGVPSITIAK